MRRDVIVVDHITGGKAQSYRETSEALHRDGQGPNRREASLRMLWECGIADLIRDDFYGLFELPYDTRGAFLDAGCGTAIEARNLARLAPALRYFGVDISSIRLAEAVATENVVERSRLFQSALEALPFADGVFEYLGSHEVVEHVENPAVVIAEFYRVLKPGGVCVIATPNGASLWVEHLRQRLARLIGRRGAPVGEDHTRPPGFWRREFRRAGFVVERRMFDGAAFEFLTYVAPVAWMTTGFRLLEPLRVVPVLNLLLCDRVKYRLRKRGACPMASPDDPQLVCPLCRSALRLDDDEGACERGHRFARNIGGWIDFTATLTDLPQRNDTLPQASPRPWLRRLRRASLAAGCVIYIGFLVMLVPLGFLTGKLRQPLRK